MGEDKHYYSAPYQYIGQKLKVVYTRSLVRIFHQHILIAVHKRKSGIGRYTTNKEHLCSTHQYYLNRSPEYYKKKAGKLSETLKELVELIFSQNRYPEQLYKSCDGLFSLHKNTSLKTFEKACQMAIDHQNYSYLFVQNVIRNKTTEYVEEQPRKNLPDHHNIRGKEYYNNQLPLKLKNNGEY